MNLPYYQYAPARGGLSRHIGVTFLVAYKANKSTISLSYQLSQGHPMLVKQCWDLLLVVAAVSKMVRNPFHDRRVSDNHLDAAALVAGFNIEHVLASKADAEARKP